MTKKKQKAAVATAKAAGVNVGDKVTFLRSENKAVSLSGEVVKIHGEGVPCVDIRTANGGTETAHVDDVTVVKE